MNRRRWLLGAMLAVAIAFGLGQEAISVHYRTPESHLLDFLTGLSYLIAGAVCLDRRPGNRIGGLMFFAGVAWFLPPYSILEVAPLTVLAQYANVLPVCLLAHIVLAYPSGHLSTRLERVFVATMYTTMAGLNTASLLVFDPQSWGCAECSAMPAPWPDEQAWGAVRTTSDIVSAVLAFGFVVAVVMRYRRSTVIARRDLLPLWVGSSMVGLLVFLESLTPDAPTGFPYFLFQIRVVLMMVVPLVFLYGLLAQRTARTSMGGLVVELDEVPVGGDLDALLSRALGDPNARLIVADSTEQVDIRAWVADAGLVAAESQTLTVVERDGRELAAIIHERSIEPDLVAGVATASALAIENDYLQRELRNQLEEVRASRARIVAAADEERRRVERDLHDGAQQRLLTLALALRRARMQAADGPEPDPKLELTLIQAGDELKLAIDELRELARGIHPAILTDSGLGTAVVALADRTSIPVDVQSRLDRRPPASVEAAAYFVVSEALANIVKHAEADKASIRLSCPNGVLEVCVIDNGRGGATMADGSGLHGLLDRVAAINGTLDIVSEAGCGTTVRAHLPVTEGDAR